MRAALRLVTLLAVALAAAASATRQGAPAYPAEPYPQEGYGQAYPPGAVFFCTDLDAPGSQGSLCFQDPGRCEEERRRAQADGAAAGACRPQTPVACFQLGGEPSPSMEVCAATAQDCELWRLIDQDKNGQTGAPCAWRHAEAPPRGSYP
jgi:hypothetical protein